MSLNQPVQLSNIEAIMIVYSAMRDFADGLTRGFSLFFTERRDFATYTPKTNAERKRR
jgi:hypothetical protein